MYALCGEFLFPGSNWPLIFQKTTSTITQSREYQVATPTIPVNSYLNDMHAHDLSASRAHQNVSVWFDFTGYHDSDGWTANKSDVVDIFLFFQKDIIPRLFQDQHSSDRISISAVAYSEQDGHDGNLNVDIVMSFCKTSVVAVVAVAVSSAEGVASVWVSNTDSSQRMIIINVDFNYSVQIPLLSGTRAL